MLRIVSFGAGVQSTTILAMIAAGRLERPDALIFADTHWEPRAVYDHLQWCAGKAQEIGLPLYVVSHGDLRADSIRATVRGRKGEGSRAASMPFYTRDESGEVGIIQRQCTREYKLDPVNRKVRELLGAVGKPLRKVSAEIWLGISLDEVRRMKPSREAWKMHRFPLIDAGLRRSDCLHLLAKMGWPEPPRSACIGCPFHSGVEWKRIRENPAEWADAVEFDAAIRNKGGMRGQLYLHRSGMPLDEVPLDDSSQMDLFTNECEGMCGV